MPENALGRIRRYWFDAFVATDVPSFEGAVRSFMYSARDHDMPIERTLAMLKAELGSLTPVRGDFQRADALIGRAVQIVITEYHEH
jgi:hypothetical protein